VFLLCVFFDGLLCEFSFRCLADLDKPVCSVGRCSRAHRKLYFSPTNKLTVSWAR
jgi:hypothetical protein